MDASSEFIDDLLAELRDQRLTIMDGTFIERVRYALVTKEEVVRWALRYYALTKHGRLAIANFYANSPDDPVLRHELAENIYEEETGRLSGVNRCHMDVFLDFLAGLGVSDAEADAEPGIEVDTYAAPIPRTEFYAALAVYGLLGEAPNAAFCEVVLAGLQGRFELTAAHLYWFDLHARLDKDHGAMLGQYVSRAAAEPGGLERIRELAFELAPLYRDIWDGIAA
jgi:pyrroloquinoline quinone (PQQ) biosynthesis protein C